MTDCFGVTERMFWLPYPQREGRKGGMTAISSSRLPQGIQQGGEFRRLGLDQPEFAGVIAEIVQDGMPPGAAGFGDELDRKSVV